jgi:hypothetical protein
MKGRLRELKIAPQRLLGWVIFFGMSKVSRNHLCPCGSGKKYKKCCLEKDTSTLRELTAANPEFYNPAALNLAGESYVPAIVCEDESDKFLYVMARASRPMNGLEAAEEADADLSSTPGLSISGVSPDCLRFLHKIGYRVMPGVKADDVELLSDLLPEEDFEDESIGPHEDITDLLYGTAEQQIRENNPPEVRQTLVRLRRLGHSRDDIMDMIVHVMMHESMDAAHETGAPNMSRYVAALLRLPELDCDGEHSHS